MATKSRSTTLELSVYDGSNESSVRGDQITEFVEGNSSVISLTSQEEFDDASGDILEQSTKSGWCRGKPLVGRDTRRQLMKMLVLIFVPVLALCCLAIHTLCDDVNEKNATERTETILRLSTELGEIVHRLQVERDMRVFYYTTLGPTTKSFLVKEYDKTDEALLRLSTWPADLDTSGRHEFSSKKAFQQTLSHQRLRLRAEGEDMYKEIEFYTSAITVFIQWLYDSIRESKYGTIWKPLVAYLKIVTGKDNIGIERALGSNFYVKGKFQREYDYQWYLQKYYMSKSQFRSAENYSPIVKPVLNYGITVEGGNLSNFIKELRTEIMMNGRTGVEPSLKKGQQWYDTMTLYLEVLLDQQLKLADIIAELLTSNIDIKTQKVIISCTLLVLVILVCPIVIMAMDSLTGDIQRFGITLVAKSRALLQEKMKADTLLYQMMPKPVAEILKTSGDVEAEYFNAVTVLFSTIVGFAKLTSEVTPMEVAGLLNSLYTCMDEVLDQYDVYKVETISDSYMIASGLPKRNRDSHSTEIANLALDLIRLVSERQTVFIPSRQIRLRIGISTGPVVAGIVGTKLPRYCLFGDTVNTASRMESNGLPDRIHISARTQNALRRRGGYVTRRRGTISVKGKGQLVTYFLVEKGNDTEDDIATERRTHTVQLEELPGVITELPEYLARSPVSRTSGYEGEGPSMTTSGGYEGEGPSMTTSGGYEGEGPSMTTPGGYEGEGPSMTTSGGYEGEGTSMTTSGGYEGDGPSMTTSGGYEDEDPSMTTSGGYEGDGPSMTTSGGYEGESPSMTTSGGYEGEGPSMTTSGGYEGEVPSMTTSGGYEGEGPSMTTSGSCEGEGPTRTTSESLERSMATPPILQLREGYDY